MTNRDQMIKKRHFPRIGKCICCYCISEDKSAVISTYLLIVFFVSSFIYAIHRTGFVINTIMGSIVLLILIVSLIFLLIGFSKVKINYLKQFKYVFFTFLLYTLFDLIFMFYQIMISDSYYDDIVKEFKKGKNDVKVSQIMEALKLKGYIYIGISSVEFIVYTYYYLVTCSYIEDIESTIGYKLDNRDDENGI